MPGDGVYAVEVQQGEENWPGALNIGPNPTFGEHARKVEVHLIHFEGDLLGQKLAVDFLERLPAECLVERISGDAPPDYLVGPAWCLDKPGLRMALEAEFARRDTWQGRLVQ